MDRDGLTYTTSSSSARIDASNWNRDAPSSELDADWTDSKNKAMLKMHSFCMHRSDYPRNMQGLTE